MQTKNTFPYTLQDVLSTVVVSPLNNTKYNLSMMAKEYMNMSTSLGKNPCMFPIPRPPTLRILCKPWKNHRMFPMQIRNCVNKSCPENRLLWVGF